MIASRAGLALLGSLLLLAGCSRDGDPSRAGATPVARGVPVTVATAVRRDVPVTVTAVGNVQPVATVSVLSQVNGQVLKIHFTEGQDVREGDLLFTLDPRPFQASLGQAEANLGRGIAALGQAEAALLQQKAQVQQAQANLERDRAQLDWAQAQERRYQDLFQRELIAREQLDQLRTNAEAAAATVRADDASLANARAATRAAEASVEIARAAIRADQAAVESARLQLGYTRILSPMAGRTGNLLAHEGTVVKANDVGNSMVVINQVRPIYVAFSIPEQYLADVRRYRAAGSLRVEAIVPGQAPARAEGTLAFINNTVDAATGTIQLKASFPNDNGLLWPGQFVNAQLTLSVRQGVVVVPSQAVQSGQNGSFVFVVKPDLTVDSRPVSLGLTVGPETVVERGVMAGERVVIDGQLRLAPGVKVDVKTAAS